MKIAYYSPLPPAPTGVADYSASLLPYLVEHGAVEVNPDRTAQDAVSIYHVGNNQLHREIYERALSWPGIAVIHDGVLQHFYMGTLDEAAYVNEFIYNYGEFARGEAEDLWRERSRSGADARYFARPMLKRIATTSRAVIVHNPAAAAMVRAHAPDTQVFEIPHLFVAPPLPDGVDTMRFREALGLGPKTLLIGAFGHQRETKRLHIVMRAFRQALRRGADLRLLIAGDFVSDTYARAIAPDLLHPAVIHRDYLPGNELWRYAAATEVCVNLRYPSAAESSGIATSMMGIGKTVIFTRDRVVSQFPDEACLRVDLGPGETDMLADYFCWLADNRATLRKIGRNAEAYIKRQHAPERVAALYWDVVKQVATAGRTAQAG